MGAGAGPILLLSVEVTFVIKHKMDVEDFLSATREEFWLERTCSPEDLGSFPKLLSSPLIAPSLGSVCENQRKGV